MYTSFSLLYSLFESRYYYTQQKKYGLKIYIGIIDRIITTQSKQLL